MFGLNRFLHIKHISLRNYCTSTNTAKAKPNILNKKSAKTTRNIGQPTCDTHPHILKPGEVTPRITKTEYQTRRRRLIELVSTQCFKTSSNKSHLIVIPSAAKKYMSDKIPYVFRQNTEFLYLTGCQEPDCCAVITISDNQNKYSTLLFTRNKDEHAELWDGPRTYPEDAPSFFGVDQALPMSELGNFLNMFQKTYKNVSMWYDFMNPIHNGVHKTVEDYFKHCGNKVWESPVSLIDHLRLLKSSAEVGLMQESCDIAAEAFKSTIKFSRPGINESQLFAMVDCECRMKGAEFLAYPPVVAGGSRATTIHYINNNQIIRPGELILMDAGCEYHGYSSDITRTWPISGTFSPQQKIIYEIVLHAQEELIKFCHTFPTLQDLFEAMCLFLGKGLQEAGVISVQPSNQYLKKAAFQVCPHHVSHYLGMDVHDTPTISREAKLVPGMVITVEPGIYISSNNQLISEEYHGIGIRIEDDVLITENGPVVLSRNCPKSISDIENLARENQC